MSRTVLFLCTGNYYRSRYAEELFNSLARQAGLRWTAASRGLAVEELGHTNVGPISTHTKAAMAARGTPMASPVRGPLACCDADLSNAALVVALKEAEHRPWLDRKHPGWSDRIRYWHVHDLDQSGPEQALGDVADLVAALVNELSAENSHVHPLAP